MSHVLTAAIREEREYAQLLKTLRANFVDQPLPILANGMCEGAADAFLVSVIEDNRHTVKRPALILCAEEKECVRLSTAMERFGLQVPFFVGRDLTFYNITASHEYEYARLRVLLSLLAGTCDAVVTTPDVAVGYTIPPEKLAAGMMKFDMSTEIELSNLTRILVQAGYRRMPMVDGVSQFSVRGGIVDIYAPHGTFTDENGTPAAGTFPLRIELFDNEIDRMGIFDIDSQRVVTSLTAAAIPPAREILYDGEALTKIKKAIAANFRSSKNPDACETMIGETAAVEEALRGEGEINFADKYISLIYPEKCCLLDYFKKAGRSLVFLKGTSAIRERLKAAEWHMNQTVTDLTAGGTIAEKYAEYSKPAAAFELFLDSNAVIHVDSMSYGLSGKRLSGMFGFRTKHMVCYAEQYALLTEDLTAYEKSSYRILLLAENEMSAKNLYGNLQASGHPVSLAPSTGDDNTDVSLPEPGKILILWQKFIAGYELLVPRVVVLSTIPDERTGSLTVAGKSSAKKKKKTSGTQTILSYADLNVGDFVVHEAYGIGRYTGLEHLTTGGVGRDYIGIQYAGSDKLFIPVENMDRISKYIGAHAQDGLLRLNKLGTDHWARSKARVKGEVKEMAKDLIRLYAERMRRPGFAFDPDSDFQRDFEASFAYTETDCQLEAAKEIKRDMMKSTPMDRLLCGDVGFGKTEVAMRAAYKAVLSGKQVAILVPTTLLALQHYQTLQSRMRSFAVNVDMLSRFRTPKQQAQTLRRLKRGETDIIVGTHKLLAKTVEFNNLGLLIVDEEQRFGVAQKEKIKQLAPNVDVLTLTATPIPRTLNMAMGGIRDISLLDEAPGERQPVQTYVLEEDELIIEEAIRRELRRGGQVYYLHNFVESIDAVAAKLSEAIPQARVVVAHGQMEKDQLEKIWESMTTGEIDILVCTTIIETGVDISNANTLIVDNAHRMGLSQLHQLRGRVGRSPRRAYAYFTYPRDRVISEVAAKRLEAVREYAEFGAGFKIALRDLEIRGAGNLLGVQQHGHLDAIGYDLYIKLLNNAVLEEQGKKPPEKQECTINLHYDAFLPESYVHFPTQRMAMYKRIAMISVHADYEDLLDELIDRYGEPPRPAMNLLSIALLRAEACRMHLVAVKQDGNCISMESSNGFNLDAWGELAAIADKRLRMVLNGTPRMELRLRAGDDALDLLHKLFRKYPEILTKKA